MLASYSVSDSNQKPKGKNAACEAFTLASHCTSPKGEDGLVTTAIQGDGVHVLNVSVLRLSYEPLGSSINITVNRSAPCILTQPWSNHNFSQQVRSLCCVTRMAKAFGEHLLSCAGHQTSRHRIQRRRCGREGKGFGKPRRITGEVHHDCE